MPKQKTAQQALNSLMQLCSRAEKSSGDALRLMKGWQIESGDRAKILDKLLSDRYIDDNRYAEAYIREKSNLNGWGEHKIRMMLKSKGIENSIIEKCLSGQDPEKVKEKLVSLVKKKSARITEPDKYKFKAKLIRYALSLGYDYSLTLEVIQSVIS